MNPRQIVTQFRENVTNGNIPTWIIDSDGDFSVANPKWRNKAWFHIHVDEKSIGFGIISSRTHRLTKELYAVYHGRLATCLLAYFDEQISGLVITPQLDSRYDFSPIH